MQLLPWEGAGASLCTAPLSHSQSVFGKWNRSIHLRAAPAIGASQPEKSVPLQGRISLQAQNSTSLLRGSQHPAELGGHPLHPADKLLAALGQYPLIVIDIVLQTDPDITAHRQGGQGNLICTPADSKGTPGAVLGQMVDQVDQALRGGLHAAHRGRAGNGPVHRGRPFSNSALRC